MPDAPLTPRVRFAPSPTGYLHVGGARTALFNWLFARHFGGVLILRIEDTDFERSSEDMVQGILEGMRWLGLDWDEGPFFQSQRLALYRATAEKLLASGHAYYCFCTKEELEQRRAEAVAAGRPPMYDRRCRASIRVACSRAQSRWRGLAPCGLRFLRAERRALTMPSLAGLNLLTPRLEDFVLLRSDGIPTYHLSVVADDLDMRLTHIIRGADHISNTPKQVLQYQALGEALPVFAHLPLILGPDKSAAFQASRRNQRVSPTRTWASCPKPSAISSRCWDGRPASRAKDREIFSSDELIRALLS